MSTTFGSCFRWFFIGGICAKRACLFSCCCLFSAHLFVSIFLNCCIEMDYFPSLKIFIEVELIYNIVLVSGVQHSDSDR